jgi:ATP-dependent Clp protease ATP-binding subunit ClpA
LIEDKIKSFFVDEVLFGSLSSGGTARADWRDGDYHIETLESAGVPEDLAAETTV